MPAYDGPSTPSDDSEDEDACICGTEHFAEEHTSDEELPPASGGIEIAKEESEENEDDVDGCELDFIATEHTDDQELPAAMGGVQ